MSRSGVAAADDDPFKPGRDSVALEDSISTLQRSSIVDAKDDGDLTILAGAGRGGGKGECWRCHREISILEGRDGPLRHPSRSSTGVGGDPHHRSYYSSTGSENEGEEGGGTSGLETPGTSVAGGTGRSIDTPRTVPRNYRHPRRHRPSTLSPGADTLLAENSAFDSLEIDEMPYEDPPRSPGETSVATPGWRNDAVVSIKRPLPQGQEVSEPKRLLVHAIPRRHDGNKEEMDKGLIGEGCTETRKLRETSSTIRSCGRGGGRAGFASNSPTQRRNRRRRGRAQNKCGPRRAKASSLEGRMSSAGRGSRSKRARSSGFAGVRGGGAVPGRRRRGRFFEPEDEVKRAEAVPNPVWFALPLSLSFSRSPTTSPLGFK